MFSENDVSHEVWLNYLRRVLIWVARLVAGHIPTDDAKEILVQEMLKVLKERELSTAASGLLLGESERNVRWLRNRPAPEDKLGIVHEVLRILVLHKHQKRTLYQLLAEIGSDHRFRELNAARLEEILDDMATQGWIVKDGRDYRQLDTSIASIGAGLFSRRMRLANYGSTLIDNIQDYLAGEENASLHALKLYGKGQEFSEFLQAMRNSIQTYFDERGVGTPPEGMNHEEHFSVLFFTGKSKPRRT